MSIMPGITVNGVHITDDQINAEVQYHPAESLSEAKYCAMQALVIKELLLQRAIDLGIYKLDDPHRDADAVIQDVLQREISVPSPDDETCRRYYDQNRARFFTSPLLEVSHILFLAPPDDERSYAAAEALAKRVIQELCNNPEQFADMAKKYSKCSSAAEGGHLGQITKGQTMPAFEQALMRMKEGQISESPVASEVGYHIIKVHRRLEGEQLPYDAVKSWVAEFIEKQSWDRAFSQYIQLLAGVAKISGFRLRQADTPLVQ